MIRFSCLLLCVSFASCYYISDESEESVKDKIVGGRKIDIKLVPYTVQIVENGRVICGGTIVKEEWILTAAHCFQNLTSNRISVITGVSQIQGTEQRHTHRLAVIYLHQHYNNRTQDNDIALLKLMRPMKFDESQNPIAISTSLSKTGDRVKISGFGKTKANSKDYSNDLKAAIVPVVDQHLCQRRYAKYNIRITANMFCAGRNGTDSCQGDSGGPAVINGELAGIVSFGKGCALPRYPGVYTQVYKYRQWIAAKTGLIL